ncbi:Volume-regulated anion channel subunit lrrc8d, partial [Ameca splendens]
NAGMMFTLTEVASLNDIQPTYRILKPWWDVFMDYLGLVMLMLAIFAMTMQITKDNVACLPYPEETGEASETETNLCPSQTAASARPTGAPVTTTISSVTTELSNKAITGILTTHRPAVAAQKTVPKPEPRGVKTNLDFQQYVFINQMCYHVALPWYSKYFPYLTLIHTIILMVSSNFWFKYPKTSSKIEHFVSILGRCFESPWTTKALSETACEDSEENKQRLTVSSSGPKQVSLEGKDEGADANQSTSMLGVKFSADKPIVEVPSSMTILDKKDGEQAKALFEKVRKFRAHVEDSDFIYKLYVAQTSVKTVKFILILSYTFTFLAEITFRHCCEPDIEQLTGYKRFYCTHNMAFMLKKLLVTYMALILIYGITCLYSLFWVFRRPLKEYSFEKVREESSFSDIPDVKNDFAFLLHMVDQYDQLYSKRFGVFLSEVSENKLREISLNHEWTFEKLKQHVTRNAHDQQELHLFMVSGLPNAVFDLTDLEVLKLELIPEVRFSAKVSQMTSMQELHLSHCPAKVEQTGFAFLRDHLRRLHVKFTDVAEIPPWVYLLRSLRELYLMGNLNSENNKMIGLESMRDLRHLKTLCLKSNLTKLPVNITELSPHLLRLVVHNDGTKLLVLNSLKKMTSLIELELLNCELERIPHAIFSLTNLQELDLKSNNIRTIEEIISFQHLKRLTCLKFWHNKIITIPSSIGHVKSLESLHLSHNKLESLPSVLFTLPKLRHLDVGHNSITVLPPDVGLLNNLQHLAINSNKLETLPKPLFRCTKLKVLCLGHNALTSLPEIVGQLVQLTQLELRGNCLDRLPAQLGNCRLLRKNGLIVEDHLFDTLPVEIKETISRETNVSFSGL